ncbi:MAG: hypothetical protein FDZ69_10200 [Deltaproteobacteria bacterium]|nr:MAG: hypothetical protein FDZ69_10200 [Deltaproteobacteria bacterium]
MLAHQVARECYDAIRESTLTALRRDLLRRACDYARIRAEWPLLSREERLARDQRRTLAHNAFIDSVNIMGRNMAKEDEDNSWRESLGDDRKLIGDLACYVHLFLGLEAR